ncbi:MAG: PBP1A family penicillin-binding protein [Bacteriovoracaceae bacterium]|nr:PBP1A family penicillin-binding protein [Bacteriovoracaceae bacterium]
MVFTLIVYISFELPEIASLDDYSPPIPSQILSKDGEILFEIGIENRELVPVHQIPMPIIHAFLAAEDDNFYNHKGVDYFGVLRALAANLKAGRVVQGGSTITQQVAKQLLLSRERSITRKIKDFLLAQRIEEKFTKEEILYLYLNQVYLGGGYYGVKSAFKGYFDKELNEASVAECALIAGLLVAPGKYSPYVNPKYSKIRQQYVLKRMFDTGKINEEEYKKALAENIKLSIKKFRGIKAGYFSDWIRQRVTELVGEERLSRDGFEIVTTLDWKLQAKAEEAVVKGVRELDKRQGFKGATGHTDLTSQEFFQIEENFRRKAYRNQSNFFIFNKDGTATYEFAFEDSAEELQRKLREQKGANVEELIVSENETDQPQEARVTELTKLYEYHKTVEEAVPERYRKHFVAGNKSDDPFINFINVNDEYTGTVVYINNYQRLIVASMGGLRVAIPYEGFRWAHERHISEDKKYFAYVTRPTEIVKVGDRILVKIKGKNQSIWNLLHSDFKGLSLDDSITESLKKQQFLVGDLEQDPEAEGALLSVDPYSGEIISLVGGYDFAETQFNRVIQSNRQPGSSFKPILFAAALENGYSPSTQILDSPQALGGADQNLNWKPRNYDGKFEGLMTFRTALEKSRNIPTIKLTQDVGISKIIDFVKRLDIPVQLPNDLSISLGSFGINLENIVRAYSIFPNGGKKISLKSITSIKDRFGNVYSLDSQAELSDLIDEKDKEKDEMLKELPKPKEVAVNADGTPVTPEEPQEQINPYLINLGGDQVYDERLSFIMTNLLKGVIRYGTGMQTKNISSFIGGKTGTTNSYVDSWFIGFTSNTVTGVWTGFDNNKTLGWAETGAKSALPIWREFMTEVLKRRGERDFTVPEGIINVLIDKKTGKLAGQNMENPFMEAFVEGTEPGQEEVEQMAEEELEKMPTQVIIEDDDYYSDQ